MPLTPETLPRHELNGLHVAVVDAANPDLVGISGRVVRETTRTLAIEGEGRDGCVGPDVQRARGGATAEQARRGESRVWTVPKQGTTFEFALTDEAADRPGTGPRSEAGRKGSGTASERELETAGDRVAAATDAGQSGSCEGTAYVTVDGARLLSRPARRTETGGTSKWR